MTNPQNVAQGTGQKTGGYIFRAPLGTALPSDASTALNPAFKNQGYASNDGLTRAISKAYEIVRDWNGDEISRWKTETSVTADFTLVESANAEVAKSIFGEDNVSITTVGGVTRLTITYKGDDVPASAWAFLLQDGDKKRRIGVANGQIVTEDFTQEFRAGQPISYPVTLTMFKDSGGAFFREIAEWTPSSPSSSSSSSSS